MGNPCRSRLPRSNELEEMQGSYRNMCKPRFPFWKLNIRTVSSNNEFNKQLARVWKAFQLLSISFFPCNPLIASFRRKFPATRVLRAAADAREKCSVPCISRRMIWIERAVASDWHGNWRLTHTRRVIPRESCLWIIRLSAGSIETRICTQQDVNI